MNIEMGQFQKELDTIPLFFPEIAIDKSENEVIPSRSLIISIISKFLEASRICVNSSAIAKPVTRRMPVSTLIFCMRMEWKLVLMLTIKTRIPYRKKWPILSPWGILFVKDIKGFGMPRSAWIMIQTMNRKNRQVSKYFIISKVL